MVLAEYQQELVGQIYEILIGEDNYVAISLYGDSGSGRTTIALGVTEQLQEGWSVFYLRGNGPNLAPYLTWHIGTKIYTAKTLNLSCEIAFGINFPLSPLSAELGATLQRNKQNFILTSNEDALLTGIRKQISGNKKILLIADDYELWDIPSKQFLQKIMMPELALLPDCQVAVLFVSREKVNINHSLKTNYLSIPHISDDDVLSVLRQNGWSKTIDMKEIRLCAGNDLTLALMAAQYYEENTITDSSFNEIMDHRYRGLLQTEQNILKTLEPLSIIDSYFTKDEAVLFIDSTTQDMDETEYQAEECLFLAEEKDYIVGVGAYQFASERVKAYFKSKLSSRERVYHRKFAAYLQKRHPEDYYNRGKHLKYGVRSGEASIIAEAWQLLFLAYMRWMPDTDTEDLYGILPEIDSLLHLLPYDIVESHRYILKELQEGYEEFLNYHYKNALYHLQAISVSLLCPACHAEVQRMILLCHVQLAEDRYAIQQAATELYDIIEDTRFSEDEQYCRATLVLLDVYLDRSNNVDGTRTLKKNFNYMIQNHLGQITFNEFNACYNRKAALYFPAIIAVRQTEQSVQYYRSHFSRNGLYMALCNHSGNAIVLGEYETAKHALAECTELLESCGQWYYPSPYKVENNKRLLTYLVEEKAVSGDRQKMIAVAQKSASAFSQILDRQEDEVSYVIFFNHIGLSMLCNTQDWRAELDDANRTLIEIDEYYQYYLHDLNLAAALLRDDMVLAKKEFDILGQIEAPLLSHYKQILFRRRSVQERLIEQPGQLNGDPVQYHQLIANACAHIQDPSCSFFGRGFLLSDLQFLSF